MTLTKGKLRAKGSGWRPPAPRDNIFNGAWRGACRICGQQTLEEAKIQRKSLLERTPWEVLGLWDPREINAEELDAAILEHAPTSKGQAESCSGSTIPCRWSRAEQLHESNNSLIVSLSTRHGPQSAGVGRPLLRPSALFSHHFASSMWRLRGEAAPADASA